MLTSGLCLQIGVKHIVVFVNKADLVDEVSVLSNPFLAKKFSGHYSGLPDGIFF
jgi:translation elongation factor EF-1alpha